MTASTAAPAVLGVDTATSDTAVAVVRDGEVLAERLVEAGADGRPRHAASLLGEVEAAVEGAGGWDGIGRIGVGVGPGTFTGLRIGISTVRALAQGRGLPVAAVDSLAALAHGIGAATAGGRDRLTLIDARRGEVFAALERSGQRLWPPFVSTPEALCERLAELAEPPIGAGDGSLRFRGLLEAAGVVVPGDADPAHRMAGRDVCALAEGATAGAAELVKPIYLRRPDAEVWRERQPSDTQPSRLA
jgi:tRNA threonylcarbamoyladenosine biosynthesis protein TsaB